MDLPTFPERWKISAPELIAETFSSRIWKVRLPGGELVVVKDLKPFDDVEDELRGAHLLSWRRGEGLVRILDMDGNRMLLEYAGETMLSHVLDQQGDKKATEIAADVMARLHSPSDHPVPPDLQPLRERFESLFKAAKTDRDLDNRTIYVEAAEIAERLLGDPHRLCPLHGDLHHENIMHGARGWLAIDPKGVFGDPAFDAANMFYNPLERDDLCSSPDRIAHMVEVFSKTLGQHPRRLLDFAIAYGCLSAAWHREDANGHDEGRELGIAAAIRDLRDLSF